jgi:hypothetical protein
LFQLQKAAKLLDTGAVRATRFLWRHPVARVSLLFYLARTTQLQLPVCFASLSDKGWLLTKYVTPAPGVCAFVLDALAAPPSGTQPCCHILILGVLG